MKSLTLLVLIVSIIYGCASTPVQQNAPKIPSDIEAANIIERVFLEQSDKYRPQNIVITNDFIGISEGMQSNSRSRVTGVPLGDSIIGIGNNTTVIRDISSRIYFDSIGDVLLYKKRDWFIIQILDRDDRVIKNVYCRHEDLSNEFIGAINYFYQIEK